jgi:AcrR family transcriptional regulator
MATTRTSRQKWVDEALRALAWGGPDAVRVESLARALGVTKGGFYWQFEDRVALIDDMLDVWERVGVDDVIARVEHGGGDARSKLRRLFGSVGSTGAQGVRADLAFRDWARRDKTVAKRQRKIDNRRMEYLRTLFREFCPDESDVEARCMLVYTLWLGNYFIAADHGGRSRAEVLKLAEGKLLA